MKTPKLPEGLWLPLTLVGLGLLGLVATQAAAPSDHPGGGCGVEDPEPPEGADTTDGASEGADETAGVDDVPAVA